MVVPLGEKQWSEIAKRYIDGDALSDIARHFSRSERALTYGLRKRGITR